MINYLVLDLETTSKEAFNRKGNPWFNNIVAVGLKNKEESNAHYLSEPLTDLIIDEDLLVGHNLKFDLLYLWKFPSFQSWLKRGGRIWDTMVTEYFLTGQTHKYPALREIAVNKYDCPQREKLMEKYWDDGKDTSEIPAELVIEDVTNDVLDTEKVFLKQYELVKVQGMSKLIEIQMDLVLSTIEMEYNGMKIDLDLLNSNRAELEERLIKEKEELHLIVNKHLSGPII